MDYTRRTSILVRVKRHAFVGLAFVLNILLSNVCLIGTAYGAQPADSPAQHMLSREVPMSFNVVTCTWVKTDDGWQPTPDSPCASGKCLKKSEPDTRCLFAMLHVEMPAQLPPVLADASVTVSTYESAKRPIGSPPPYPGMASTVMRM